MMTSTPQSARIPDLDGLRGFAILSVVLMHFSYNPDPRLIGPVHAIQRTFALGWTGVDLFFVLSGFLIGGILMDHRDSPSYFKTFYLRRAFRIIPIYYLWICLLILLIAVGGPLLRTHTNSGRLPPLNFDIYQHFLFSQNLWMVNYITLANSLLSPTWSLAVEEQFYLVAPLLIRYLRRGLIPGVLLAIIVLAPILRLLIRLHSGVEPNWPAYQLMPCRADALAIGMLVAYAWRTPTIRGKNICPSELARSYFYGSAGRDDCDLVALPEYPNDAVTQTVGYSVVALFYASVLLITMGLRTGPIAKFMRWKLLQEFGRISCCLYLIHVAVGYFDARNHSLYGLAERSDWTTEYLDRLCACAIIVELFRKSDAAARHRFSMKQQAWALFRN